QFSLMGMHPQKRAYFVPETVTKEASEAGEFEVTDLPPGMYQLSVRTIGAGGDAQAQQGTIDPARFSDRRAIQLTPGETEEAVVAFVPFDENSFRGERSVAISVLTQAGTPAAGKSVKVSFNDPHY